MKGLTSEFGMGSGVPPSLLPPTKILVIERKSSYLSLLINLKQRLRKRMLRFHVYFSEEKKRLSRWTD